MRKTRALVAATSAAASLVLAAVPAAGAAPLPPVKTGGTLQVAMPWASVPHDFNPLAPGATAVTAGGTGSTIYEPLIYANPYTGSLTDMLATGFTWSDGSRALTVTTRPGVSWSDGTPFSAADVAFTFNLLKRYPALDVNGLFGAGDLTSVSATGPDTVVFTFSAPRTSDLQAIVGQSIVPEHLWDHVADPVTFTNTDPVGTGPFTLKSWTAKKVTYVKNPHYWMPGRPYISSVVMTADKSGATAELAVLAGKADETYFDLPNTQNYVAVHPTSDAYWWPVVNLNLLYFNDSLYPFDAVNVRKAVAEVIDPVVVTDRAYFGSVPAATEPGVTNGEVGRWVPSSVKALEFGHGVSTALKLLQAHGYKVVDGRLETSGGSVLPAVSILIGEGWYDYSSMAETISQQLASIGINATVDEEPLGTYEQDLKSGNFSTALSWTTAGGYSPYYIYAGLFATAPTADAPTTAADWERYTSPAVTAALAAYNAAPTPAMQEDALATVEKDMVDNVPVVPLTGRPNFLDYSTHTFTGWPDAAQPYDAAEPPDAFGGGAEQVFLNVHQA